MDNKKARTAGRAALPGGGALKYVIITFAAFAGLVTYMVLSLAGGRTSGTSFETMSEAVVGACDLSRMQQADNQMIKRLYGLDPADFDDILLYYPQTNMGAEELFLVRMRDSGQKKMVSDAVTERLTTQKNSFEGYGVEQSAMLEKAVMDIRENYGLLIVGDDPGAVYKAFSEAY